MATASQAVASIARLLALPHGRLKWAAERLRLDGELPKAQGTVIDLSRHHVSLLIIAAMLDERGIDPPTVVEFAALRSPAGTLSKALAALLANPSGLVRIQIDAAGSAAVITDRVTHFGEPDTTAVSRLAVLDGEKFTELADAISNAPRLRAGRPPNRK